MFNITQQDFDIAFEETMKHYLSLKVHSKETMGLLAEVIGFFEAAAVDGVKILNSRTPDPISPERMKQLQ